MSVGRVGLWVVAVGVGVVLLGCGGGGVGSATRAVGDGQGATTRAVDEGRVARVWRLVVEAEIDGSDEVVVTGRGLEWRHREWDWPGRVVVNGRAWDVRGGGMSAREAGLEFGPGEWARAAVRVVGKSGRDVVAVEPREEGLVIYFADTPGGAGVYRVEVEFEG